MTPVTTFRKCSNAPQTTSTVVSTLSSNKEAEPIRNERHRRILRAAAKLDERRYGAGNMLSRRTAPAIRRLAWPLLLLTDYTATGIEHSRDSVVDRLLSCKR